jgi:hypothetical protein
MSKMLRIAYAFAGLGFVVAAGRLAYDRSPLRYEMNRAIALSLCPPAILLTLFIDIEPTIKELVAVWLVIASLNAALYAVVAASLSTLWALWKSN